MPPPTCPPCLRSKQGPARPAALVGLASTHACRLNRPSRDHTCFDKRCRPCRPAGGLLVVSLWVDAAGLTIHRRASSSHREWSVSRAVTFVSKKTGQFAYFSRQ